MHYLVVVIFSGDFNRCHLLGRSQEPYLNDNDTDLWRLRPLGKGLIRHTILIGVAVSLQ